MDSSSAFPESRTVAGGRIPGSDGAPAFVLTAAGAGSVPVLIAVPHAGRGYPAGLLAAMRQPDRVPLRLEDRLVDRLAAPVSHRTGAALLVAEAPRAMIDLNRAPADFDLEMIAREDRPAAAALLASAGGAAGAGCGLPPGARARAGLGLVPRRLPLTGEIWRRPLRLEDLAERLAGVHRPYHAALAAELAALRARWGAALLIDLHSMPSLPAPVGGVTARVVVGDRFGASCDGRLVAETFAHFASAGVEVAHNRPYAGGYGLDRHAAPQSGIHALQLEIDRSVYLDATLAEPGQGFAAMAESLAALVRRLAGRVVELAGETGGPALSQAAE